MVAVRFSDDEWNVVGAKAAAAEVPVTSYVRQAALDRELASGANVIAELRRLGGLQKKLFTEGQRIGAPEYAQILLAITDAIERIAATQPAGGLRP
jgi:hypothetical protein